MLAQAWATLDTTAPAIEQLLHPAVHLYGWYAEHRELGRTLLAIMENHQQEDGTIAVPQALVDRGAPETLG